jgi:hypothetical protein
MEDGGEMNVQPKYNEAIHEIKIDPGLFRLHPDARATKGMLKV